MVHCRLTRKLDLEPITSPCNTFCIIFLNYCFKQIPQPRKEQVEVNAPCSESKLSSRCGVRIVMSTVVEQYGALPPPPPAATLGYYALVRSTTLRCAVTWQAESASLLF